MFISQKNFNFVDKIKGTTKDGVSYLTISVIDAEDNHKYSFYTDNPELIDKLNALQVAKFSEIILILSFERIYNQKTRFSNWQVKLIGVK